MIRYLPFGLLVLLLVACTAQPTPTLAPEPTAVQPTPIPPTATPQSPPEVNYPGLPLPVEAGEHFSTSGACTVCHTNMVDESGADVSIDSDWRAGMMANAARDPYWLASVRSEGLENPDYRAAIEDKCAKCHMPMARFSDALQGGEGKVLDDGFLNPQNELHIFAMDGVSCTLCHQITETNLGEDASYSGAYVIDAELPRGERIVYGPYPVTEAQAAVMTGASGFIPAEGEQVKQSELCATCHTLYTPFVDAAGQIGGEFPEQMPYREWLNSDYRETRACQDCHMPQAQGGVVLSITGGDPRSPFFQHASGGSNAYMLNILRVFGEEIGVTASSDQFGDAIGRTLEQLQNHAATVAVKDVRVSGSDLTATVVIESQVGHKFPSAYPSRRAWLHVTVRDAGGQVIFESGKVNPDGSIVGNDNDADPASYEPHYITITSPDQVQIYEAIMQDSEGDVTTTLLRGAKYVKDNRLLPAGFEKDGADADVATYGLAVDDVDFLSGGDQVQYSIDVGGAKGPFTVSAELLYQSIGYRWANNLSRHEAAEIERFLSYYEGVPNLPVVVIGDSILVD